MKRSVKGGITVFLSLILLMVLTLLFSLLESARVQGARAQCLANADLGMFSLFSEYDRDLLELYEVFFLDAGYGQGGPDVDRLNGRLAMYTEKAGGKDRIGVYQRVSLEETRPTALMLAADASGLPFVQQAVSWAKEELILSALGIEEAEEGRRYLEEGEALMGQADSVSEQIEAMRDEAKRRAEEAYENEQARAQAEGRPCTAVLDTSSMEFENPIDTLKRFLEMGVLGLAAGEEGISNAAADIGQMMSNRDRAAGWGSFGLDLSAGSGDRLLFNEYILEKLPCFTEDAPESFGELKYQCEYVLAGKSSDRENLKTVLERLLLFRFGMNFAYLLSSQEKQLQAEAVAAAITALAGLPMLMEVMKTAILLLWAYEESLSDIRTLCQGGKVEFIKTDESFSSSIEQLFSFQPKENGSTTGLDYKGYLRILLAVQSLEKNTFRCMDMVEHTIRIGRNRPQFCLDAGVFALKAEFRYHLSPLFLSVGWSGSTFDTVCTCSYWNK